MNLSLIHKNIEEYRDKTFEKLILNRNETVLTEAESDKKYLS